MKYPIGIQKFERLREENYVYVDKTALMYDLVTTKACCFLSRPRRFGKSLLMSTLEAYFQGRKELFKGLAIEELEKDWISYPVIHIDLNNGDFTSVDSLRESLSYQLKCIEQQFGVEKESDFLGFRFEGIIRQINKKFGRKVVILIDEYDKPMLEVVNDELAQEEYRKVLKPFYGTLKKIEEGIRFIFLTGVTKFAKLNIFSDLNQVNDISLMTEYDTICGITSQEVISIFKEQIEEFARLEGQSYEEMSLTLKRMYDGYHFSRALHGVYNPYSILNALEKKEISNFWFNTGTPTFLVRLLQGCDYPLAKLAGVTATATQLTSSDEITHNPLSVIFQSGYLTIKDYNVNTRRYTLDYPNEEVKRAFLEFLLPKYASLYSSDSNELVSALVQEIRKGDIDDVLKKLQSLFSKINYELILDREAHFKNIIYLVFELIGMQVQVERHTSQGSIDMVVETEQFVYIIEFKYNGTPEEAIKQIRERGYAMPYQCDKRTIYEVGVNFSSITRNIESNWKITVNSKQPN